MMSYLVHVVTSLKLLMVNKMHIKMYISNTPKLLNPPRTIFAWKKIGEISNFTFVWENKFRPLLTPDFP